MISVIIPVYEAEKSLRKCVESIIFGQERNLEVILIDDCSNDGSWGLCQQLAQEYDQVRCLRNERNSGVSYTRNRGLAEAAGRYVLFVDSDDWVSSQYAQKLLQTQKENPGKLVLCGYHHIDHTMHSRMIHGVISEKGELRTLRREAFFRLSEELILQQLWNKVFELETIRDAGLQFDENISMGEDLQFVLDYMMVKNFRECVIINQPLYYYIRWNNHSLMGRWVHLAKFEKELSWVGQLEKICGGHSPAEVLAHQNGVRQQFLYNIVRARDLSRKEKLKRIEDVMSDGKASQHYRRQTILCFREWQGLLRHNRMPFFLNTIRNFVQSKINALRIGFVKKDLKAHDITLISQDCIGGVFSRDMDLPLQSPTVDLYFSPADFIKFVSNLEHYLNTDLEIAWGEDYPLGRLGDVELDFVGYETCQDARTSWDRRRKLVNFNRIAVVATDCYGFEDSLYEKWKKINYPKLLMTARKTYASEKNVLYFSKYEKRGCVPDLITKREFYKNGKLLDLINNADKHNHDIPR